nr:hypothetical protein Iba_chr04bCG9100 [Ipomoea batatas]
MVGIDLTLGLWNFGGAWNKYTNLRAPPRAALLISPQRKEARTFHHFLSSGLLCFLSMAVGNLKNLVGLYACLGCDRLSDLLMKIKRSEASDVNKLRTSYGENRRQENKNSEFIIIRGSSAESVIDRIVQLQGCGSNRRLIVVIKRVGALGMKALHANEKQEQMPDSAHWAFSDPMDMPVLF